MPARQIGVRDADRARERSRRRMIAMKIISVTSFVVLAGCATMKPTAAQERVYQQVEDCSKATSFTVNVVHVSPDGKSLRLGEGRMDGLEPWKQCMVKRYGWRW